jgi:hypothetical protein
LSPFEFLVSLYAIVAGLGLSLLIQSIGQMIEARDRVRLYWVHSVWLLLIFLAHVVSWLALWRFTKHDRWTVLQVLLLLSMPILLYLVSHLAVPDLEDERTHDLREYYYRHSTWMHALMLGVIACGSAGQIFIEGRPDFSSTGLVRITIAAALLPGTFSRKPAVHAAAAAVMLAVLALGVTFVSRSIR